VTADATGRFSAADLGEMPDDCLLEACMNFRGSSSEWGMILRSDSSFESCYQIRFEPARQRMVFDRWPRPGDQAFVIERPLRMEEGRSVTVRALVSGSCLVIYANDRVALSARMYDRKEGRLGLFVSNGFLAVQDMAIRLRRFRP